MKTISGLIKCSFFVIAAISIAASCDSGRSSSTLRLVDSLAEDNPDSAYNILYSMTTFDLSSEEDVAYYDMLMSYVLSRLVVNTDSVALKRSITYYADTDNKPMLQRCWLYMGMIRLRQGALPDDVECDLIRAARLIDDVRDSVMAMRIYEHLAMLNMKQHDTINALRYARMLNTISAGIVSNEWRMRGNNAMALAMGLAGRRDSMLTYVAKAEQCIPDSFVPGMNNVYNKIAFMQMHIGHGDMRFAKKMLNVSLYGGSDWRSFNLLADLYLKTGREKDAFSLVNVLMSSDNAKSNVWLYNSLSEYYAAKGQFKEAYIMKCRRDSAFTVVNRLVNANFATDLWQKYDQEVVRRFARRKMTMIVFICFVVITSVLSAFVVSGRRLRKRAAQISALKNDLLQMQIRINKIKEDGDKTVKEKTEALKTIISEKQAAITELSGKLSVSKDELKDYLSRFEEIEHGLHYLYSVMRNENISQLNKSERESLIECYRVIDMTFVHRIEQLEGSKLTIQEKLFCVLRNMGKDENIIKYMLGLSDEAYRKTRSRALNKLRNDKETIDIADKIK